MTAELLPPDTMSLDAGQIQAFSRIDYIPQPEEVYDALSEMVFGAKGRTRATGMLAKRRCRR